MLISIVIPCYYSENTIRKEVELIINEFDAHQGYDCEIILVNDGSKDDTFKEIRSLTDDYPCVRGVNLTKNFGQMNAIMAALHYTKGDYIVSMDDDMQTHPSQLFKLVHKIEEGYDLVYGVYPKSKNGPIKQLTSKINRVTSRIMLQRPKSIISSNFWIATKAMRDEVIKYNCFNPYVDAIFYKISDNIGMVDVEHFERDSGVSGYTFKKLFALWLSYWNYSVIPLRVSFFLGLFSALGGIILAIWLIINKFINPDIPIGWSSTMCFMSLLFGAVLMVLGVIGEYLGKIILILNNTPQYVVKDELNIDKEE